MGSNVTFVRRSPGYSLSSKISNDDVFFVEFLQVHMRARKRRKLSNPVLITIFYRKCLIRVASCPNGLTIIAKLVLMKTPTPRTPLLWHVLWDSSSPVLETALNGWCPLASPSPTTLFAICLACMNKFSI